MGFSFRKTVRLGPMRINLSKSGIGASVGVKGARLTASATGKTYVTVGTHGFFYRQALVPERKTVRSFSADSPPTTKQVQPPQPGDIPTADVTELKDSSSANLIAQLNERARIQSSAPLVYVGSVGMLLLGVLASKPLLLLGTVVLGAIGLVLQRKHKERCETRIFYELDNAETQRFAFARQAITHLSEAQALWRVNSKIGTRDQKRNAGASTLVKRTAVMAGRMAMHRVETNVEVTGIDLGFAKMFFLPDVVLYWQSNTFAAIAYFELRVVQGQTTFVEEDSVPGDAAVVGQTWQFVNKAGAPDRRFKNNRQLPMARYGTIELRTPAGLNIHLQVSSADKAAAFANCLFEHAGGRKNT